MLSAAEIAAYRNDGYRFPLDILTPAETDAARARLEAIEAAQGGPLKAAMRHKPHLLFPWLNTLIRHPRIIDAVTDVLGPDILCWSSTFFIKEAADRGFVSWHQDATYWGLSEPEVTTLWLALTPATLANGCMKFIPGSHMRQVAHRDTFDPDNLLTRGQELEVSVNEEEAVAVELAPGQASLHHVLLFHGSAPNRSGARRIGLAIRYIPTRIRQIAGARDSATLVAGEDRFGHFDPEPAPEYDLAPEALALHAAITERQQAVLYRGTDRTAFRD
ncbi:MAG: phytanoyl-CoA dioxygenase family protein [Rhodospirillales bacterium]|nr:phytanoyl-CoA dioxygenase family protein [Rhodospirillales bacterium]